MINIKLVLTIIVILLILIWLIAGIAQGVSTFRLGEAAKKFNTVPSAVKTSYILSILTFILFIILAIIGGILIFTTLLGSAISYAAFSTTSTLFGSGAGYASAVPELAIAGAVGKAGTTLLPKSLSILMLITFVFILLLTIGTAILVGTSAYYLSKYLVSDESKTAPADAITLLNQALFIQYGILVGIFLAFIIIIGAIVAYFYINNQIKKENYKKLNEYLQNKREAAKQPPQQTGTGAIDPEVVAAIAKYYRGGGVSPPSPVSTAVPAPASPPSFGSPQEPGSDPEEIALRLRLLELSGPGNLSPPAQQVPAS